VRTPGPAAAMALVALTALLVQAPGLDGPFLWDDLPLLAESDLYTSTDRVGEALEHSLGKETFYWRPLATLVFLGESLVHGIDPMGFRAVGALLHAAVAALVFTLLGRIGASRWAALLGALVFAVHPVHAEAVTWPSARFDLLAALASLGCLAALGPAKAGNGSGTSRVRLAAVGGLAALALLSKENAFVLPALVLAWDLARDPPDPGGVLAVLRKRWRPALWAAGGLFVVALLRLEVLGYVVQARDASVSQVGGPLGHALLVGRALSTYLGMLVFPFGTVGPAHYAAQPLSNGDPAGWVGLILGAGLLVSTGFALRRRPRLGFLLVGFFVSLLPVSQVFPLDMAGSLVAADRFLYLPSVFAIAVVVDLAGAFASEPAERARTVAWTAGALVVAMAGFKAFVVLPKWGDAPRFWESAQAMAPGSDVALANLADAYIRAGRGEEAETAARQLVEQRPGAGYETLLSRALRAGGRDEDAALVLDRSLTARPNDVGLLLQRGDLLIRRGEVRRSLKDFERALAVESAASGPRFRSGEAAALSGVAEAMAWLGKEPIVARERAGRAWETADLRDTATWLRLSRAYFMLKDTERGLTAFERAGALPLSETLRVLELAARVDFEAPLVAAAQAGGATEGQIAGARAGGLAMAEKHAEAATAYRRAAELEPDTWDWGFYLYRLVTDGKAEGDPVALARDLVRRRPDHPEPHDLLGYELFDAGDKEAAERELETALDLDASWAEARYHLGMLYVRTERVARGRQEIRKARTDAAAQGRDELVRLIDATLNR